MKVVLVYVFANLMSAKYEPMARRFAQSYCDHPPGETNHDLIVVVNGGGPITPRQERLFDPLVPKFIRHDNSGKDLGAYLLAARTIPADLMIFMGSPSRPRTSGWLDTMVLAMEDNGPGVYGPWGQSVPRPHLKTTVFFCSPELILSYPHDITDSNRYFFEFGEDSITRFALRNGFNVAQVTARGVFPVEQFHMVANEDCLVLDQFTDTLNYT